MKDEFVPIATFYGTDGEDKGYSDITLYYNAQTKQLRLAVVENQAGVDGSSACITLSGDSAVRLSVELELTTIQIQYGH